jgi:hypothetical protein
MPSRPEQSRGKEPGSSPRSRFQPQARAGLRLEERDELLLCDLFTHRAMSREQLQALHFSSLVRANARLRQLFDHRFVSRHYPPAAPFGAQAIYSLGRAALPVVARWLELELPEVARRARVAQTPTFIEHTLAVVDICLAFRQAARERTDVEIERWLGEFDCRHEWDIRSEGGRWRKETFKPDGFVRLIVGSEYHNFFIEADLGHTSSRQFLGKLQTHQRYLESGLFNETYGCPSFRTLVVTTGARRMRNLVALAKEQGSDLFWFATFESLKQGGALGPIWQSPPHAEETPLF